MVLVLTTSRFSLNEVWGEEHVDEYWKWIDSYISSYEENGNILPGMGKKKVKFSGMRAFLGELTALASGEMNMETYTTYTEARLYNGKKWQEGRRDERVRIQVPTKEDAILLSSIPPEYPMSAWEKIKTFTKS